MPKVMPKEDPEVVKRVVKGCQRKNVSSLGEEDVGGREVKKSGTGGATFQRGPKRREARGFVTKNPIVREENRVCGVIAGLS